MSSLASLCYSLRLRKVVVICLLLGTSGFVDSKASNDDEDCAQPEHCLSDETSSLLKNECPHFKSRIFTGFFPLGNATYNIYEEGNASDIENCAIECCQRKNCHYAFMLKSCHLVTCINGKDFCVPTAADKSVGVNVSLVQVADPDTWKQKAKSCEVGADDICGPDQKCIKHGPNDKSRNGACMCKSSFVWNSDGDCVPDPRSNQSDQKETDNSEQNVTTLPPFTNLAVSVESKNVTLPQNEVYLNAYAVPQAKNDQPYSYQWTLISHPKDDEATIEDGQSERVHLSGLRQGTYAFQISVTGEHAGGTTNATVHVIKTTKSLPPKAVITPKNQTVQLPTQSVILDSSFSADDDEIKSFKWELQKFPVEYKLNSSNSVNSTTFKVDNLIPGSYIVKLIVEDADHNQNSTTATITVLKERDYAPTSIAGDDVVIYLPQTEVILNGNKSTDDKKIVEWEWKATGDSDSFKAVDMQDTHTPFLKLSHLQEGMYQFELKVTDESHQSDSSTVHVIVKPASGNPPIAKAGKNHSVVLPHNWSLLDASKSSSESYKILKFEWHQLSGPTNATILNITSNGAKVNVTSLTRGQYCFGLNIEDEAKLQANSSVCVTVEQGLNKPPVAAAGKNFTVTLPLTVVELNGSDSSDDVGITKWEWKRHDDSLAAGKIILDSDKTPILRLTNLVPGEYGFSLKVIDEQGLSSEDSVYFTVLGTVNEECLIDIILNATISKFTHRDKKSFVQQVSLMLRDITINVTDIKSELNTRNVVLTAFGVDKEGKMVKGLKLVKLLRSKMLLDDLLSYNVLSIDTVICLSECSGHGYCADLPNGRACVCNTFWMENFFRKRSRLGEINCDWSKIYVGVVLLVLSTIIIALFIGIYVIANRRFSKHNYTLNVGNIHKSSRRRSKRPASHVQKEQRYALLESNDNDDDLEMEGLNMENEIDAESEDSDSDILFESSRASHSKNGTKKPNFSTSNGFIKNGILKKTYRNQEA